MDIMISAGEASGDLIASHLVTQLKKLQPEIALFGMGGPKMREAGVAILQPAETIAVNGVVEMLRHYLILRRAMKRMQTLIVERKPALLILVDYPGFHLRLAEFAKKQGVKVLYYVSPKIWAWGGKRIYRIAKCVDAMAVVFPFEEALYKEIGVQVRYVGHPLIEFAKTTHSLQTLKQQQGIPLDALVIGLFPGSRRSEITQILPEMLRAASLLQQQYPQVHWLLPVASFLSQAWIQSTLASYPQLSIRCVEGSDYDAMASCDLAIAASGTVTLELALLTIPMVVVYRVHSITYHLLKRLLTIDTIALPNILAKRRIVVELVQRDFTAGRVASEVTDLIENSQKMMQQKQDLKQLQETLMTDHSPATNAAQFALEVLAS